jgi:hypothetical protein
MIGVSFPKGWIYLSLLHRVQVNSGSYPVSWSVGTWVISPDVDCVWNMMTRAEASFRLSAKQTSPFKSAGASVQSTTGSRGVRISVSTAGYTKFRSSVKGTGYPLHSPVSPSLPLPCVAVFHHISTGLQNGRGVKLNIQIDLEQRLRMSGAIPPLSHMP